MVHVIGVKMWSRINHKAKWIAELDSKKIRLGFKVVIGVATVCYSLAYGCTVGVFVFLASLAAFQLPVLIIYFKELFFGPFGDFPLPSYPKTHQDVLSKAPQPYFLHEGGLINAEIDASLESFLNGVLEKFVIKWQSSFESKEEYFVAELQHALKFVVIRLLELVQKVDLSRIIVNKVVPLFIWHLDCYCTGLQCNSSREMERFILSCFGTRLHPALESRRAEESYLRHCSDQLLQHILPIQLKTSKLLTVLLRELLSCQIFQNAMDAIADPDNINHLIILWLDENEIISKTSDSRFDQLVPALKEFSSYVPPKPSEMSLYPSLSSILKNTPHLYQLMQFLKREHTLKYLQFSFAVDEFNEKLLNPDLNSEQMKRLQLMGQKMNEIYFCPKSSDCIGFDEELRNQMEVIVSSEPEHIVQLRTSPTLFKAYDHVMDILEQKLIPRFYRSPEFYLLVSGAQQSGGASKSKKKKGENVVAGWGRKLRLALRPSWLADGRLLGNPSSAPEEDANYDTGIDLTEADFIADDLDTEQDSTGAYTDMIPVCGRDLTAWRACIPKVVTAVDSAGKSIWAFEVDIQRIDLRPEDDPEEYHWSVVRTYTEFYHLESKLTEFHGEFVDIRLPAKKMFGTRNAEFLQSVRPEFESFLRTLLQQPALKGSDLIFSFLTLSDLSACQAVGDGSLMGSNLLPDLGLGRMMRTVPLKLRKERGQHLESFLQTFIASTEPPKPRPSKMEVRDPSANEVSVPVIQPPHPIFQDNAKSYLSVDNDNKSNQKLPRMVHLVMLEGPYECLLYAAWKILALPSMVYNILVGLGGLISIQFDYFVRKYAKNKLANTLKPQKITLAIKLLQAKLLDDKPPDSVREIERKHAAWKAITDAIPLWAKKMVGAQPIESRCEMVFQCLQVPVLNKQLSYMLFDTLLDEICPEIFTSSKEA